MNSLFDTKNVSLVGNRSLTPLWRQEPGRLSITSTQVKIANGKKSKIFETGKHRFSSNFWRSTIEINAKDGSLVDRISWVNKQRWLLLYFVPYTLWISYAFILNDPVDNLRTTEAQYWAASVRNILLLFVIVGFGAIIQYLIYRKGKQLFLDAGLIKK